MKKKVPAAFALCSASDSPGCRSISDHQAGFFNYPATSVSSRDASCFVAGRSGGGGGGNNRRINGVAGGEDVRIMAAAVVSGPASRTGGRRIAFRLTLDSLKGTKWVDSTEASVQLRSDYVKPCSGCIKMETNFRKSVENQATVLLGLLQRSNLTTSYSLKL